MSNQPAPFLIVGAGLASALAAETLREEGYDGPLVLIGAEPERPYERPPLSKEFLRGEADGPPYAHEEGFYAEHEVELRTGETVTALDPGAHEVELEGGERLGYSKLLLSTGAEPVRLPVPGADLDGVRVLRSLADSRGLGEVLRSKPRVAVIGAGWIGCEVAASARQMGCEVTVIDIADVPLERVLGPEMGAFYRDVHRAQGVRMLAGEQVEAIEGDGSVSGVRLAGGETVAADLVVVGIGVRPRVRLAEAAGLAVDDGILVDPALRTSAPDVFAAGDVANAEHPFYGRRIRVEHWANAREQGVAAARSMLGEEVTFAEIPYFFSDQYDTGMEYRGWTDEPAGPVVRGEPDSGELIAFWLREGRLVAGMNVNVWDVSETIRDLIQTRAVLDPARLADPDVPLGELLDAAREG